MGNVVKNLYELQEKLEKNIYVNGVITYNITERSKMFGEISYSLNMVELELEKDEVVFFIDEELKLVNNNYIISGFLVSSVEEVKLNCKKAEITFKNGDYVIIEALQ